MNINPKFRQILFATHIAALIISTNVLAESRVVEVTKQIKGYKPELLNVISEGKLQVGKKISIPDTYVKDSDLNSTIQDLDGDEPLPLDIDAGVEWFLVPDEYNDKALGTKSFWLNEEAYTKLNETLSNKIIRLDGTNNTPNYSNKLTIVIPSIALGKRLGFKVTTKTKTGFPTQGDAVYVMNAFISDSTGPIDPVKSENKPLGTIDAIEALLVVETHNSVTDTWLTIIDERPGAQITVPTDYDYSVVNQKFRASIVDEEGNMISHLFKSKEAFSWGFQAKEGMIYNGKPLTSEDINSVDFKSMLSKSFYAESNNDGYFYMTLQDKNQNSKVLPLIEQGLQLFIQLDNEKVDTATLNNLIDSL